MIYVLKPLVHEGVYMDFILEVKALEKNYGSLKAVKGIDFGVKRGSFFAFLGPNGAGKSTTIKMITTLLKPSAGQVFVNGLENSEYIRRKIGVVFQDNVLDGLLTVKENLLYRGAFYLSETEVYQRYEELKSYLEFESFENQKFKTLSGGQKRRVEIARALFSNPEILLLDEPTTGLDPETRGVVWKLVHKLKKEKGMTIFLTTHYMEEAANADYVLIINQGEIVAEGTPATLKEDYSIDRLFIVPKDKKAFKMALESLKIDYTVVADRFIFVVQSAEESMDLIAKFRPHIKQFEVIKGTLDDVFVNVIGGISHV